MRTHTGGNAIRRTALVAIYTLGLIATGGCEVAAPSGPQIPDEVGPMLTQMQPAEAFPGDLVSVVVQVPHTFDAVTSDHFRMSVRWDPARFEYVETFPRRSTMVVTEEGGAGRITVEANVFELLPKGQITLVFRALIYTGTLEFDVFPDNPRESL